MLSLILVLFVSLMLPGVINRVRARLSGRRGVSVYQHINNVGVLMRKGAVYSPVTTFVFRIAPVIYLGAMITALLFIPVGYMQPLISFKGDLVFVCYLFALSRVVLILAAMDTASSFEGMGASREALYGALVEPALFLVMGTLALVSRQTSFNDIFLNVGETSAQIIIVMVLVLYLLVKIMIVEGGRVPIDDPRTHLELTMIHEVMILDYCSMDLAMITIGGWLKMGVLAVIASSAIASVTYYDGLLVVVFALLIGCGIGVVESFMARNRMSRNTTYILTILVIALVLFILGYLISLDLNIV